MSERNLPFRGRNVLKPGGAVLEDGKSQEHRAYFDSGERQEYLDRIDQ